MDTLIQRLFPNHCHLCGEPTATLLCPSCTKDLPRIQYPCPSCALPLAEGSGQLCGDCQQHPMPFTRTIAAYLYRLPVDYLINRFKHHRHFGCGRELAGDLATEIHKHYEDSNLPHVITAMPLHWRRLWHRGFNQAQYIAGFLSLSLNIPNQVFCQRRLSSPAQQNLKRQERLRNLNEAFVLRSRTEGLHIALVDDVMTTGATSCCVAELLLSGGATRVDLWVLARTPKPR